MQDVTEGGIADISVDRSIWIELRMVEDIEHLQSKLKRTRFGEVSHLVESHVVVVDTWPIEHPALGVALRAQCIRREGSSIEVRLAVAGVVVELVSGAVIVRHVDARRIYAVVLHLHQIVVAEARKGHRKAGSKACDAGESPAAGEPARMEEAIEGQVVVVTDNKVMLQIEGRNAVEAW